MFDVLPTMRAIESFAAASGHFHSVEIGEPKSAPDGHGMTGHIWMVSVAVVGTTLSHAIELHTLTLRGYMPMLSGDAFEDEMALDAAMTELKRDMAGDFDLGGTVRNIDVAGQYSGGLETESGYIELSGTQFKIVDMTIPVIVDDIAEFAA